MNNLVFISEVVNPVVEYKLLSESKDSQGNLKVKIEACLQTAEDVNINKRKYTKRAIAEGIESVKEKIKQRRFLGELDHPVSDDLRRQTQVLLQNASHIITKTYWDGNALLGEVETLSTPSGKIMASLIKDNVTVGFSVRALGNVIKQERDYELIDGELKIIAYDCVSNPSHQEAVMLRLKNESANVILESAGKIIGFEKQSDLIKLLDITPSVSKRIEKLVNEAINNIIRY